MKKRKKIKITLLTILIIIIAAGSYLLYQFKFKEYDTADEEVSEIIEDPYVVELPDGTTITIDEEGNVVPGTTGATGTATTGIPTNESNGTNPTATDSTNTDQGTSEGTTGSTTTNTNENTSTSGNGTTTTNKNGNTSTSGNGITTTTAPSNNTGKTPTGTTPVTSTATVASIKGKYTPVFQGLESQADGKINALIGRAKSEYQTKQANGESVNYAYFYSKYMDAATSLEAGTDSIFNGVLAAVENDLVANGFDKSYAQSFKSEYEATKEARRSGIIDKAMGN
jgi:ABC-type cobalt transport system substrate-binding protein